MPRCGICGSEFDSDEALERHLREHHKSGGSKIPYGLIIGLIGSAIGGDIIDDLDLFDEW